MDMVTVKEKNTVQKMCQFLPVINNEVFMTKKYEEFTTFKFNKTRHPKEFLEFLEKNKKDFVKF